MVEKPQHQSKLGAGLRFPWGRKKQLLAQKPKLKEFFDSVIIFIF